MLEINLQYLKDRITHNILYSPDGCWLWTGSLYVVGGYGRLQFNNIKSSAHRWSALAYGIINSIDEDTLILHKCDIKRCVNPEHLYSGDTRDNSTDFVNRQDHHEAIKTHCPQGHEYSSNNIIITTRGRRCKACHYFKNNTRAILRKSERKRGT
jgi:hypothetical protein